MSKKNICKENDFNEIKNNINKKKCNFIKNLKKRFYKYKEKIFSKNKIIDKLKNKLLKYKKKNKDLNLRCKADLDNMYKRNQMNVENVYKYSLEKFSKNLLPVIDNLKNALKVSKNKKIDNQVTYEGLKLTLKNFLSVIEKFGISVINKINVNFDPNFHQAVSVVESNKNNIQDNLVIEILQDGYILNKRLLRPAMVKVIKFKK